MPDKVESELFAHTTSMQNLERLLASGQVKSLKHLATDTPGYGVSVEPKRWSKDRSVLKAIEAVRALEAAGKDPDKVFLTRDSYHPEYGDSIIVKRLKHPRRFTKLNTIPNEFYTRRRLSLRNNVAIYVPKESLDKLRRKFPGYKFKDKDAEPLPVRKITQVDRPLGVMQKLHAKMFDKTAESLRGYGSNAFLAGSEALGTAVPGKSDRDIFVPYKRKAAYDKAILRMAERFPEMELARRGEYKSVFTDGDTDLVIGFGEPAKAFAEKFKQVQQKLSPEEQETIRKRKQELSKALFFPKTRHKLYKKSVADRLGLSEVYF